MLPRMKNILLLLLLPVGLVAKGHGDGGGHPYESKFKEVGSKIYVDLLKYKEEGLFDDDMFNINLFKTTLEFGLVQCANAEEQKILEEKVKMMYYFSDLKKVALDCSENYKSEWEKMDDPSLNQKVLVTHEILRSAGIEKEDEYVQSSKLFELSVNYENEEIKQLTRSSDPSKGVKCEIVGGTSRSILVHGGLSLNLTVYRYEYQTYDYTDNIFSISYPVDPSGVVGDVYRSFLFQTSQDKSFYRHYRDHFVREFKRIGCWE